METQHQHNLKTKGITTTAEGVTVSTVEQHGTGAGQQLGKVWVKFPGEGARWHWYFPNYGHYRAQAVALQLAAMTEKEIREFMNA